MDASRPPLPLNGLPKCIYTLFCTLFPLLLSPPAKTIQTIKYAFPLWFVNSYRVVLNKVIEKTNQYNYKVLAFTER